MLCVSYIDATTFIEEILMKLQKTIIDRLHRMCLLPLPWLQRAFGLVALLLVSLLLIPPFLHAQDDQVVPYHPYAKELPELGRMIGILGEDCLFGEKIYPIGDCNGDSLSDWILSRRRCDTTIDGKTPEELLLYKGEPGRLPDVENRLRIGPSEIGAKMKFLAAGDWDGINGTDLAVTISLFGDTSQGGAGFDLHRVVIFWNDGGGNYSVSDTTRIPNVHGGNDLWLGGGNESLVHDYNHDGVEDVLLDIGGSYRSGEWDYTPRRYLFLGCAGERWGKDGKGVEASLEWWSPPPGKTALLDQDVDGYLDMIFYHNTSRVADSGSIRIIYGREGVILDTGKVVEVSLAPANGKYALFADITGDRVPELLVNAGGEERLKAYVGFKGQRVEEQFGSGEEPGNPGEEIWWGKPWASIPLPGALHDAWANAGWSRIYDFGDGGLDGVGDVWVYTVPDIICYQGGKTFDSIYDGWIRVPCGGGGTVQVIGNAFGHNIPVIAVSYRCDTESGIKFTESTKELPTTGRVRRLPPGTDTPDTSMSVSNQPSAIGPQESLGLAVHPNPSSGEVVVSWGKGTRGQGDKAIIRITDLLGQEVLSAEIPVYERRFLWDASDLPNGIYYGVLTTDEVTETRHIRIQR